MYTHKPKWTRNPDYATTKADKEMINHLEAQNWSVLDQMNVEESWSFFVTIFEAAIHQFIPTSMPSKDKRKKLWMNRDALAMHKRKRKAWKQYKITNSDADHIRACQVKNNLSKLTRQLCKDFEKDLARNVKSDPKAFWRYCNTKLKNKPRIGDIKANDGTKTQCDLAKADILNTYFASVFTHEKVEYMPSLEPKHHGSPLSDVDITADIVKKKLTKLNPNKAPGPDKIHPRVLKETADVISSPLSVIFHKSLSEGRLPTAWNIGNITPIHKKGSRSSAGNYRPVSLTSIIGKVMESIIRDHLVQHMMDNALFCDAQHGFVPGRSCMTQLLTVLELWTVMLDSGDPIDAVYLDFRKAFDSVPHQRLHAKIAAYGINGKVLGWIQAFLTDRKQCVVVNSCLS